MCETFVAKSAILRGIRLKYGVTRIEELADVFDEGRSIAEVNHDGTLARLHVSSDKGFIKKIPDGTILRLNDRLRYMYSIEPEEFDRQFTEVNA